MCVIYLFIYLKTKSDLTFNMTILQFQCDIKKNSYYYILDLLKHTTSIVFCLIRGGGGHFRHLPRTIKAFQILEHVAEYITTGCKPKQQLSVFYYRTVYISDLFMLLEEVMLEWYSFLWSFHTSRLLNILQFTQVEHVQVTQNPEHLQFINALAHQYSKDGSCNHLTFSMTIITPWLA